MGWLNPLRQVVVRCWYVLEGKELNDSGMGRSTITNWLWINHMHVLIKRNKNLVMNLVMKEDWKSCERWGDVDSLRAHGYGGY